MDRLAEVNKIISSLTTLDQNGYLRVDQEETKKKLIQERSELQKKLKKLEAERLRAKKRRRNLRTTLEELRVNPEVAEKLKKFCRDKPSKPRIEEDQPQLLKTIVDIVQKRTHEKEKLNFVQNLLYFKNKIKAHKKVLKKFISVKKKFVVVKSKQSLHKYWQKIIHFLKTNSTNDLR